MKLAYRINVLLAADTVAYALFEMQDYLTDVLGLSLTRAAATVSIWIGISLVLQPLFFFLVVTFLGNYVMLVISSLAYTLGTILVYLSAPPVLGTSCKNYEPACIGKTQKALLYTGMALIAVGVAGHRVSLRAVYEEQFPEPNYPEKLLLKKIKPTFMLSIASAGALLLPLVKHWTLLFGIPAIITAIATILFLTTLCCFRYNFRAPYRVNHISNFPKMFILGNGMTPMWLTFITSGMVSSIGRTYFVDQAKHLDRHLGKWEVPTQVLLLAQIWIAKLLYYVAIKLFKVRTEIFMAKLFQVLCCIAAAIMERKRLGIVRSHGLLDKPDQDIPMSVHWLFFQFILLGCMDRLLEKSAGGFDKDIPIDESDIPIDESDIPIDESDIPIELKTQCIEIFSQGASGLGFMCSVLLVFVVGKISEKGDKPSWFQSTSNRSHLDHYYWLLAVLSGASFLIFVVGCCFCRKH